MIHIDFCSVSRFFLLANSGTYGSVALVGTRVVALGALSKNAQRYQELISLPKAQSPAVCFSSLGLKRVRRWGFLHKLPHFPSLIHPSRCHWRWPCRMRGCCWCSAYGCTDSTAHPKGRDHRRALMQSCNWRCRQRNISARGGCLRRPHWQDGRYIFL